MKKKLVSARDLKVFHYLPTNQSDHHNGNTGIQRRGLMTAKLSNEMQSSSPQNNGSIATPLRHNPNSAAIVTKFMVCQHIYVS